LFFFWNTGIAGIRDFTKVKCLHCHYSHYLARPDHGNIIGQWVHDIVQNRIMTMTSSSSSSSSDQHSTIYPMPREDSVILKICLPIRLNGREINTENDAQFVENINSLSFIG
jgi:hypothetical protein